MDRIATLWHYGQARRRFTAWADRGALEAWQGREVIQNLRRISARSPYFEERARNWGIENWRSWPMTNKGEMMVQFDRWNTAGVQLKEAFAFAARAEATRDFSGSLRGYAVGLSSGTSGSRGIFLACSAERRIWAGMLLARVLRGTLGLEHRAALFLRADSPLYHSVGSRRLRFEFFDLMRPVEDHISRLRALRPTILAAPPAVLVQLARAPGSEAWLHPPAILLSVADVLDDVARDSIRQGLGKDPGQIYQATEGFLAATCPEGRLHWNEDAVVVEKEWIDAERTRYVPILTDFRRWTQPVIRYRLDDIIVRGDTSPCPCGSYFETLGAVEGRCDDILRLQRNEGEGEVLIYPDFVRRALILALPVATEYTVTQTARDVWEIALSQPASVGAIEARIAELCEKLGARIPSMTLVEWEPPLPHRKQRRIRRNDWA
jgi:putative adenylate-forming enzyme